MIARRTDETSCPAHSEGEITGGEGLVLVCFQPVARQGDEVTCKDGTLDVIIEGSSSVFVGGRAVACKGHKTAHDGEIVTGCPRVWIGEGLRNICKRGAAKQRAMFIRYKPRGRTPFIKPTAD